MNDDQGPNWLRGSTNYRPTSREINFTIWTGAYMISGTGDYLGPVQKKYVSTFSPI